MSKVNCFAHHHMTPAEYGFWQLCRDLSHKTGILYFDGRNMVKRFAGTRRNGLSKNYFYSLLDRLTQSGWFEPIEERKRNRAGLWTASVYRVLSHSEWVSKYGSDTCKSEPDEAGTCPDNGTGKVSPVLIDTPSSPDRRPLQSRWTHDPVPLSGHNPIDKSDKDNPMGQSDANPMDYACPTIRTGKSGTAEEHSAELQFVPPVPLSGQASTEYKAEPMEIDWDAIQAKIDAEERNRGQQ